MAKVKHYVAFIAEVGGALISYRLLDDLAGRLPGFWAIACRIALPVCLILFWRRCSGQSWSIRDMGMIRPPKPEWLELFWLAGFQTTALLGFFLLIARWRYYGLLDFLVTTQQRLNGYNADYGPFLFTAVLFTLMRISWGGELMCRGYLQGLGTITFNAGTGAIASWLVFGAALASLALEMGYPLIPDALVWGVIALFPAPLCEAYYFRNRSVIPLMAARGMSGAIALAGAGFFLYWYPDRSFSVALPLFWICLFALVALSFAGVRRLLPFWRTAMVMMRLGLVQGSALGMALAAMMWTDRFLAINGSAYATGFCMVALTAAYLASRFGKSAA